MANQRISQFTYTSTITGDELIGVAINGQNKSISVGQILAAADESCKNTEQDKRIDNNYKAIIQQEILVRETSEKMSALQITVDDLYKQVAENNNEISSYVSSVCENISSYLGKIQSNTNLISYFHADVMRLDAAISSVKDTLYKKNGIQDVLNQHTEQLVILHDELHDLEQEVAYNLDSANSVTSYLESYVYPVINNISTKVENLIEQGDEHTNQISELQSSYSNLLQSVSDINTNLNNKIDNAYTGLSLALIKESTKITGETDAKLTVLRTEIDIEKKAVHNQLDEHTAYIKDIISVNDSQSTYITNNKKDFDDAYSYIKSTISTLNEKIDSTYAYALEYTSNSYESLYNDIVNTYSYVESSYNNVYTPLVDNVARIDSKLTELSDYDTENTKNIKDLTYISNSALSLSKENSTHISYLESDYVVTHNRLENLEKDSIAIHAALNSQADAIHILHDKITTIEKETIPNLEIADTTINARIDKIVELLGADSIDGIANTVIERILELEDETAHMAYHESHPETSVWGTFGIVTGCGYKSGSCVS